MVNSKPTMKKGISETMGLPLTIRFHCTAVRWPGRIPQKADDAPASVNQPTRPFFSFRTPMILSLGMGIWRGGS